LAHASATAVQASSTSPPGRAVAKKRWNGPSTRSMSGAPGAGANDTASAIATPAGCERLVLQVE
jgi:hypothetical protein